MMTPKFRIASFLKSGSSPFFECIQFYTYGLTELGYQVSYADAQLDPTAINLVLGSYSDVTWKEMRAQAEHIIICNWEPVQSNVPWFTPRYFRQLTQAHVWDYNFHNVELLKQFGVGDNHLVPMSYVPEMSIVPQAVEQDIDVLFYGQSSERRHKVLEEILYKKGLNLVCPQTYGRTIVGAERDELISRAKVVLNMHNRDDTRVDDDIRGAVLHGCIEELAQLCYDLVHDEPRRRTLEKKGFEIFSKRNAAMNLRIAVERYLVQREQKKIGNNFDESIKLPNTLQIGAGDKWHYTYCNLDVYADLAPDLVLNIGASLPFDEVICSWRFGNIVLQRNYFHKILAHNVFQRVDDLRIALTNCLELLVSGGELELSVPLDLSHDAWMHIDDKRVFNDKTWEKIINNWWQYGWGEYRFEIFNMGISTHNSYGMQLIADIDWKDAIKIPRVIDVLNVTLHKRLITDDERKQLPQTRFMD